MQNVRFEKHARFHRVVGFTTMGFAIAPDGELSTFWTTTSVLEYIFVGDLEERKRENESYRRLLAQPTFSLPPVIACE